MSFLKVPYVGEVHTETVSVCEKKIEREVTLEQGWCVSGLFVCFMFKTFGPQVPCLISLRRLSRSKIRQYVSEGLCFKM